MALTSLLLLYVSCSWTMNGWSTRHRMLRSFITLCCSGVHEMQADGGVSVRATAHIPRQRIGAEAQIPSQQQDQHRSMRVDAPAA